MQLICLQVIIDPRISFDAFANVPSSTSRRSPREVDDPTRAAALCGGRVERSSFALARLGFVHVHTRVSLPISGSCVATLWQGLALSPGTRLLGYGTALLVPIRLLLPVVLDLGVFMGEMSSL